MIFFARLSRGNRSVVKLKKKKVQQFEFILKISFVSMYCRMDLHNIGG